MSAQEEKLAAMIEAAGLPKPERELRFAKEYGRQWRFDFSWPEMSPPVALEFEGGTFTNGAHSRGAHFQSDAEKYNFATKLGWRIFRVTAAMVRSGYALDLMREVFGLVPPSQPLPPKPAKKKQRASNRVTETKTP